MTRVGARLPCRLLNRLERPEEFLPVFGPLLNRLDVRFLEQFASLFGMVLPKHEVLLP